MPHVLMGLINDGEEQFLGEYKNFYEAIEAAEIAFINYNAFKLYNNKKELIIGTRMFGNGEDVFWRIPRKENKRNRDTRFWDFFDKLKFPFISKEGDGE